MESVSTADEETVGSIHVLNRRLESLTVCGREEEISQMMDIYERVKNGTSISVEFLLIHGKTGVGKSRLAKHLVEAVQKDNGLCIGGKFDQLAQAQQPYSALVSAFSSFFSFVLSEKQRQLRLRQFLEGKDELDILHDMIPNLGGIVDRPSGNQAGAMSENFAVYGRAEVSLRLKDAFRTLLGAISDAFASPLLLYFDDIHWADEASLDLLKSLVYETPKAIFLVSYRDGEYAQNLASFIEHVRTSELSLSDIVVEELEMDSCRAMVAGLVGTNDQVVGLAEHVFRQTGGNSCFVVEYLRALTSNGLRYNLDLREWSWNPKATERDDVCAPLSSLSDIVARNVSKLSDDAMDTLRLASCIGARIDVSMMEQVSRDRLLVLKSLEESSRIGLIEELPGSYAFTHDAIQEVVYSSMPVDSREGLHYRIGRQLWKCYDMEDLGLNIFLVVGQLIQGGRYIQDPREKIAVAKLSLWAAERAIAVSGFHSARTYLEFGICLLPATCWNNQYDLCMNLYNTIAEIDYCTGNLDSVPKHVKPVLDNAVSVDDTLRGHAAMVCALGGSNRLRDSCDYGLRTLKSIGIHIPTRPTIFRIFFEIRSLRKKLRRKTSQSVLRLPHMEDKRSLAAMQILNFMFVYSYMLEDPVAALVGIRIVAMTLERGVSAVSCIGFAMVGTLLCGPLNDIDEGYRIGRMAMSLYENNKVEVWRPRVSVLYYTGVDSYKNPIMNGVEPMKLAYHVGISTGDVEIGLGCRLVSCLLQYETTPLPQIQAMMAKTRKQMQHYKQDMIFAISRPMLQGMLNLMGKGGKDPGVFWGDVLDEPQLADLQRTNERAFIYTHFHMMLLAYLFGDFKKAELCSRVLQELSKNPLGAVDAAYIVPMDALTSIELARAGKFGMRRHVAKCLRRIRHWADHCPQNFLCRLFLVEAELAKLNNRPAQAKYVAAIATAKDAGFLLYIALTNELAGKYFLFDQQDKSKALPFLKEALEFYGKWGATAKVDHLRRQVDIDGLV